MQISWYNYHPEVRSGTNKKVTNFETARDIAEALVRPTEGRLLRLALTVQKLHQYLAPF